MKSRLSKPNDFVNDAVFRRFIAEKLTEIADFRQSVIDKTLQYNVKNHITMEVVLRCTAYTYLKEHGMLNADTLLLECVKIMALKSELPSSVRRYLGSIYRECMNKTLEFYKK